jgi:hypothetical protein
MVAGYLLAADRKIGIIAPSDNVTPGFNIEFLDDNTAVDQKQLHYNTRRLQAPSRTPRNA